MSIVSSAKQIIKNKPSLLKFVAKFYNYSIGINKKKIKGSANKFIGSSILRRSSTLVDGNNNIINIGYACFLDNCSFYIKGNNNKIILGEKLYLKDVEFYIEDDNNIIKIGDKTTIHGTTHLAATEGKKIIIDCDCMFAPDVVIRTGDSHSILDSNSRRINHAQDVLIGNHVWVGNKTILLKGTELSNESIVAAGSVVTKKFIENNIIVAGNPAKIIKTNINWSRER